jgi:hypothetical protein
LAVNRHERRANAVAARKDRFVAHCNACPNGQPGVKPKPGEPPACEVIGRCDACGMTGMHWLGCSLVGLPEMPASEETLQ